MKLSFWKKVYNKLCVGTILTTFDRIFWKPYNIMNAKETIDYIVKNQCSVARFGDGEFSIATYGCGLKFQREDAELQKELINVICSRDSNLLLCLPYWINMVQKSEYQKLGCIQQKGIKRNLHDWMKHFSRQCIYGDANISRITDTDDFKSRKEQVEYTKKIWNGRNIILVEGRKTRFGIGNDLLNNVKSISRILGPSESAFDYMSELIYACESECKKYQDPLVLIALGPTATVMAWKLQQKGIQAIDIGHLDICYEVSLRNNLGKNGIPVPRDHPVPGKYTSEAIGGNEVIECLDSDYLSQIVLQIPGIWRA